MVQQVAYINDLCSISWEQSSRARPEVSHALQQGVYFFCSLDTPLRRLPDDRLGGAEHELQHSDCRGELAGRDILHVADGACSLHRHHIVLVPQAALQEVVEAA